MSHATRKQGRRTWKDRALCLLLTAVMLFGMLPGLARPASAHWADEYLDKLLDWGVLRADQIGNPDSPITRADFMAIINRAYGYKEKGPIPFTDVLATDWFYDDVAIAYNAGYMAGTSNTTASPNATLTREMAVCVLGRNMMMKETPGESLAFSDSRDISTWAAGMVKTAVDHYVVAGYPDNSFGPQDPVSKAQMAVLVSQCVGTPIQEKGDYTLDSVFGNVTITSSDVTLRNTTISGDLYVSGGVGLGGVRLENVNVLGRIIVSGTGESEKGEASVVMRNVTAQEMLVDNMRNGYVTVRAEGLTQISRVQVRTNSYLEDNTPAENGLRLITLEGEPGTRLDLAGRLKEVVAKTPNCTLKLAKGSLQKLTVDEAASGATVQIDRNTEVKELNLDVATNVTGQGDVDKLNINAPGSTVTMLPDDIYIRPGLDSSIAGEVMDAAAAEESSRDPRILSGYPMANDVAPTTLRADFAGNKRGTIYWAVSNITDGSVSADNLISPPSYGSPAVRNGSVATPSADTVVPVQITGLTTGGSYYLSAVLVDSRGERSPVKVISFTTPDNSKPAFAQGYPYMSLITDTMAQATVMATKSCKLYYAVLPQGAPAPTTNELRSASVTGNLGYGVMDVVKNTEHTFTASRQLEERKNYVLYLWLCDADGSNSSNVQAMRFTTVDKTPPLFDPEPNVSTVAETSVTLNAGLNETGTIFWAVVPEGRPYPLPNNQNKEDNILDPDTQNPISAKLDSEYAKLQVANGRNATRRGQVAVRDGSTDVTFNVTGLNRETSYDLYYVARDTAGNYSAEVKKITIHTLDSNGPVVRQYFTNFQGEDETKNPMANSDLILQFNENITAGNSRDLLTLYEVAKRIRKEDPENNLTVASASTELKKALSDNFRLFQVNTATNVSTLVPDWVQNTKETSWVNYENVVIRSIDGGGIEVVFPGQADRDGNGQAVSLASGSRYHFELTGIRDNSEAQNPTVPATLNPKSCVGTQHVLDYFDTVFALVNLATGEGISVSPEWVANKDPKVDNTPGQGTTENGKIYARVDTSFVMNPQSTQNADPNIRYELILFNDAPVNYDLYYRILDKDKNPLKSGETEFEKYNLPSTNKTDDNGWVYLGNKKTGFSEGMEWDFEAVNYNMISVGREGFPYLTELGEDVSYEFAISVTEKDASSSYPSWSGQVNFRAYVVASGYNALHGLVTKVGQTPEDITAWDTGVTSESGRSIGACGTLDYVAIRASFIDTVVPKFTSGPAFRPGDTFVDIDIALDREATVYYVVASRERVLETRIKIDKTVPGVNKTELNSLTESDKNDFWTVVDYQTKNEPGKLEYFTVQENYPPARNLTNPSRYYKNYAYGNYEYPSPGAMDSINIGGPDDREGNRLEPETEYYIYMVVRGTSAQLSEVYVYNFTTTETAKPKIYLRNAGMGTVGVSTNNVPEIPSDIDYALFTTSDLNGNAIFSELFFTNNHATSTTPPSGIDAAKFTVLDALMTDYTGGGNDNGYSIFDVYANTNTKNTVAEIIRRTSAGTAIRGNVKPDATGAQREKIVDHTKDMKAGEYYYALAVGHHRSGTSDGFRAIDNIVVPDLIPPRVESIRTGGSQDAGAETFSGTVMITFDKPVYWIKSDAPANSRIPVAFRGADITDSEGKVTVYSIMSVIGATNTIELGKTPGGGTANESAASRTFIFNFKNWRVNDSIVVFSGDGRIANATGRSDGQALVFSLRRIQSQSGISIVPEFYVTWKDENGRTQTMAG